MGSEIAEADSHIISRDVVKLVIMPACHAGDHGFKSRRRDHLGKREPKTHQIIDLYN